MTLPGNAWQNTIAQAEYVNPFRVISPHLAIVGFAFGDGDKLFSCQQATDVQKKRLMIP
jgi:hypothetical protein